MKKVLSTLILTAGMTMICSGIQTAKACNKEDILNLETIYRECQKLLTGTSDDCQESISIKPDCSQKKRTVTFVTLGGTLSGCGLRTFNHLTQPGQGLIFTYQKVGSSSPCSVTLTTDQNLTYNQSSSDSKYPLWRGSACLCDGSYNGNLFLDQFEQTPAINSSVLLTHSFTVNKNNTTVIMAP